MLELSGSIAFVIRVACDDFGIDYETLVLHRVQFSERFDDVLEHSLPDLLLWNAQLLQDIDPLVNNFCPKLLVLQGTSFLFLAIAVRQILLAFMSVAEILPKNFKWVDVAKELPEPRGLDYNANDLNAIFRKDNFLRFSHARNCTYRFAGTPRRVARLVQFLVSLLGIVDDEVESVEMVVCLFENLEVSDYLADVAESFCVDT